MRGSSTKPIQILSFWLFAILIVSSASFAGVGDTLYVQNSFGVPGSGGYTFNIYLENVTPIKGLVMTIIDVPDYLTITHVERHSKLTGFRVRDKVEGGTRRLAIIPDDGSEEYMDPGTGAILRLTVSIAAGAPGGTQAEISLGDIVAADTNNVYTTIAAKTGFLWFGQKGDVKYNAAVDLFDVLMLIDIVIGRITELTPYQQWAGDLDDNGTIDVVDIGLAIDMAVNTPAASRIPEPESEPTVGSVGINVLDLPYNISGPAEIPVYIKASLPVSGLHLVFDVDKESIQIGSPQKTIVTKNHELYTKFSDNKLHLFLYSMDGTSIPIGESCVAKIPVQILKPVKDQDVFSVQTAFAGTEGAQKLQTFFNKQRSEINATPNRFTLLQNNPNPFNMTTNITFEVPALAQGSIPVKLQVYNVQGQLVRLLEDRLRPAGRYTVQWDGRDNQGDPVSSGVYFYKLFAGDVVLTKKLAVMK